MITVSPVTFAHSANILLQTGHAIASLYLFSGFIRFPPLRMVHTPKLWRRIKRKCRIGNPPSIWARSWLHHFGMLTTSKPGIISRFSFRAVPKNARFTYACLHPSPLLTFLSSALLPSCYPVKAFFLCPIAFLPSALCPIPLNKINMLYNCSIIKIPYNHTPH